LCVNEELVSIRFQDTGGIGSPISLFDRLKSKAFAPGLLVRLERAGYYPGERISAEVFSLDGSRLGEGRFVICGSPGSGFAGQVYRAEPEGGVRFDDRGSGKTRFVAIKVLKPKSRWKRTLRDLLFQLAFQTSYAPRLREEALRTGLTWQLLLRVAARLDFGSDSTIARPLGYFWDETLRSFAEIHEWVDGRFARYEADDSLLQRFYRREPVPSSSEMGRKKRFMGELARLCREIGAQGMARQFEWYTFVSQANVLTRCPAPDPVEFCAVDCRPGLAVPFFLPLSPVHARMILTGLLRGRLAHFDEVDFEKLDRYIQIHAPDFEPIAGLIQHLKADDDRYRSGLPDLWQAGSRNIRSRWREIKTAAINDRLRLGHISEAWAGRLKAARAGFALFLLLDKLPILGTPSLRLVFDEDYREHLRLSFSDPAYFKDVFAARQAADLFDWYDAGRISLGRCEKISRSTWPYLLDKFLLSWLLVGAHRLLTDASELARRFQSWFVRPIRLMLDRVERERWLTEILQEQVERGLWVEEQARQMSLQIKEPRLQGFIRDLGFTLGLEVLTKFLYLGLAAYGFASRNFLPFSLAVLSPIPPSGVVRSGYVFAQILADLPRILRDSDKKLAITRVIGLITAPWRGFGNLFALVEMFAYYNELSLLLGNVFAARMVAAIPVMGGPGKLLEYWAFQAAYNLPLSFRRAGLEILNRKGSHAEASNIPHP
jgi:hypothetical protein